jgi:hypothetical protein
MRHQAGRRLPRRLTYLRVAGFEFGSGPNWNIKVGNGRNHLGSKPLIAPPTAFWAGVGDENANCAPALAGIGKEAPS